MGSIIVADAVHERIELLAAAWRTTEGDVVKRLLEEFARASRQASGGPRLDGNVDVHVIYAGQRVEGVYDRDTMRIDITTGVLVGKSFNRPSSAAIAVVEAYKPGINPNRNGWDFWVVTETGKPLRSIR
ncbi:hypothetical protein [Amycolatopsis silviterrae]|uniref:Uncharacterized protein n=1 Tax=Amycolatopsis silviterrae TaxID=1656914 RepID=A0ABW5GZ16_9PSEU